MITREQQFELRKMLGACHGNHSAARRLAMKEIPVTIYERRAERLLKSMEKKRARAAARHTKKYDALKMKARQAIYFGDDAGKALKLLAKLEAMR